MFKSNQKAGKKQICNVGGLRRKPRRKAEYLLEKQSRICEWGNKLLVFVPTVFGEKGLCVHSLQVCEISSEKHVAKVNRFS